LTDNEFNSFIEKRIALLADAKERNKDFLKIIEESIKAFVPCDVFHFLEVDNKNLIATNMGEKDSIEYQLNQEGILSQCYESHQPLFINDVDRSLLYNASIDSLGEEIAKVLIIPILSDNEEKKVIGMLWIGVKKGFQQFIKEDIDNLVHLTKAIKHEIFFNNLNTDKSGENEYNALSHCQESKRTLELKIERDEHYFASTIHEIRTPMNAVIGFMELMLLNETNEQKREYIDATLKSSGLIVTLINDALDMSKVANGKMNLNKTTFSPMNGLSDIVKFFYNTMKKKSINFGIYIDPLMPSLINSDLHRIKQVINNLLSNAIKFTPIDGKIILEALYNKEKDTLKISVIDTGIGIAKEKQKSIFKPYVQEKNSTAKEYGGTGLGLAISQQLSILLNGTLTVESEQGEGSEFIFTLPCDTPSSSTEEINANLFDDISVVIYSPSDIHHPLETIQQYFKDLDINYKHLDSSNALILSPDENILILEREEAIVAQEVIEKFLSNNGHVIIVENSFALDDCYFEGSFKLLHNPILPNTLFNAIYILMHTETIETNVDDSSIDYEYLSGHTVLIIDDSIINLKLMGEILKRLNLNIATAVNAKEGLELFKNEEFDIVFIDQNMPMMNGDEAIVIMREIEKEKNGKSAIIYGLTGDAHSDIEEKIIEAGANDVFTKPIHLEEVYQSIVDAIDN